MLVKYKFKCNWRSRKKNPFILFKLITFWISLKTLAVTGFDLIGAGWKPGREMGEILQKLLELVLEKPECNVKEYLLAEAEKYR